MLAHLMAAGASLVQAQSGQLATAIRNLARSALPPEQPSFAQVVAQVEQVSGVHFADLFARLPLTCPSGDAALQAVWEMALAEQRTPAETRAHEAQEAVRRFETLLQGIAAVARGEMQLQGEIEAMLPELEADDWHISAAVQRIWAGERDLAALAKSLDGQDTALVGRMLELLAEEPHQLG